MAAEVKRLEVPGIPISSHLDRLWLCSDEDEMEMDEEKRRAAEVKRLQDLWLTYEDEMEMDEEKRRAAEVKWLEVPRIPFSSNFDRLWLCPYEDEMEMDEEKRRAATISRKKEIYQGVYGFAGLSRAHSILSNDGLFRTVASLLLDYTNERIEAKPAGIGPYSLISNVDNSPLHALLAGDVQGGGRNRNPRQITGRNADHSAIHIRVAVPTGGPDAGGGGVPDVDGGGGPDAGGGGGPDAGGGGGPPGGGPDAGGGGGPDAGGGGGPDAGGGGNLAVCVFTASVGKAALLRYTATPGSSRSRSGSTKSEVLSYLIMTFDTVAFLTSFAAIYMRRKRPQVSTILGNVAAFSLILSFLCMNMKDEFLA